MLQATILGKPPRFDLLGAHLTSLSSAARRGCCSISQAPAAHPGGGEDEEDEEEGGGGGREEFSEVAFQQQQPRRRIERLVEIGRGPNGRYDNLIHCVSDKNILLAAYQRLRARPGLQVPVLGSTDLPLSWLSETSKTLLGGVYSFRNYHSRETFQRYGARATQHTFSDRYTSLVVNLWALRTKRAEIYSGRCDFYSKEKRSDPLRSFSLDFFLDYGIHSKFKHRNSRPSPPVGDLIVQEAMHMTLEKIYEPLLSPRVHGYRRSRGCHTLFEEMRRDPWLGVCWLLEFNFENIFAKMDRSILASAIEEDVDDSAFVKLVLKLFDVKVTTAAEDDKNREQEELGVRRSVLAPLVCHIYLQRLDREIDGIIEEEEKVPVDRERRTFFHLRSNPVPITKELPVTVKYLRYVDEFVVGVGASRATAERIQALILKFMKAELRLEPDYFSYLDITFGSTLFLGMRITAAEWTFNPKTESRRLERRRRSKFRNMKIREVQERMWSDSIKRLTLRSWASALENTRQELPELEQGKSMVLHTSENRVRKFAIAKLKVAEARLAIEDILNTENAVFYNMSAIGIPEEIAKAHRHLTELLEKHYRKISKESREKEVVLPTHALKRRDMVRNRGALPLRLVAPLDTIMAELRYMGMIKRDSVRPDAIHAFVNAPDESIISYFAAIAYALLVYYRCSDNYIKVKRIVDFQVRWSALTTLAARHDFSTRKAVLEFKRGPQMTKGRDVVASFPSSPSIARFGTMFYDNVQETLLRYVMSGSRRPTHASERKQRTKSDISF